MFFKKAFIFILFGFISATELHASTTKDSKSLGNSVQVLGKVVSKNSQEPLIGATVTLVGTTRGTISDENGEFLLKNLKPQKYTLRVTYIGYKTTQKQIDLSSSVNDIETIEFSLLEASFDMDAIVVTSSLGENMLKNTPQITEVISGKVLNNTGAITVQDALEMNIPGIEFPVDGHGSSNQMQGLGSKYTLIMVDGERLSQEDHNKVDFDRLNVSQIERIEVTKGAASSIYGSNAIGGVINIITKKPKYNLESTGSYRLSENREQVINAYVGSKQENFRLSLTADIKKSDGYDNTPESRETQTQEKFQDYSITPFISLRPSDKLDINFKGNYFVQEVFYNEYETYPNHPKQYSFTLNANSNYYLTPRQHFWFSWNTDQYEQYEVVERVNDREDIESIHRFNSAKIISNTIFSPDHSLKVGAEYLAEKLHSKERIENNEKSTTTWIGFIYNEYNLIESLKSTAAVQFTHHTNYGTHISPSLSLLYQALPFNFRIGYNNGYRTPTLKEQYFAFNHFGSFFIQGNPNLEPETSHYFSSSLEYITTSMNLSASVYLNRLNNMISSFWVPGTEPQVLSYQNIQEAQLIGFDLLLKKGLMDRMTLTSGYSYVDSEDLTTGLQIPDIIKHSFRVRLEYGNRLSDEFDLIMALQGKYTGSKIFESKDEDGTVTTRSTSEAFWNWRLTSTLHLYRYFNIVLGVDNLLDYTDEDWDRNTENPSSITPGRRFFTILRYSFN